MLVSVGEHTKMHARLTDHTSYGISVLSEEQLDIASRFAGKPQNRLPEFIWQDDMALIDGAVGYLSCSIVDRHSAGDHTLFISHAHQHGHTGGAPLTFHAGLQTGDNSKQEQLLSDSKRRQP